MDDVADTKVVLKTVGELVVDALDALVSILAVEPKHEKLDAAYQIARGVVTLVKGAPAQATGQYTADGIPMVRPAIPAHDMYDIPSLPVAVPAYKKQEDVPAPVPVPVKDPTPIKDPPTPKSEGVPVVDQH